MAWRAGLVSAPVTAIERSRYLTVRHGATENGMTSMSLQSSQRRNAVLSEFKVEVVAPEEERVQQAKQAWLDMHGSPSDPNACPEARIDIYILMPPTIEGIRHSRRHRQKLRGAFSFPFRELLAAARLDMNPIIDFALGLSYIEVNARANLGKLWAARDEFAFLSCEAVERAFGEERPTTTKNNNNGLEKTAALEQLQNRVRLFEMACDELAKHWIFDVLVEAAKSKGPQEVKALMAPRGRAQKTRELYDQVSKGEVASCCHLCDGAARVTPADHRETWACQINPMGAFQLAKTRALARLFEQVLEVSALGASFEFSSFLTSIFQYWVFTFARSTRQPD